MNYAVRSLVASDFFITTDFADFADYFLKLKILVGVEVHCIFEV